MNLKIKNFCFPGALLFLWACSASRPVTNSGSAVALSQTRAHDHYLSGALYDFENQYKSALVEYRHALRYDSTSAQIFKAIGRNFIRLRENEKAINYLTRALRFNPTDKETLHYLAETYYSQKDFENAAIYYERLVEVDPYNETVYSNLIYLYSRAGEAQKLIALREKLVELLDYEEEASVQLWSLYMQFDKVDKALALSQKLLDIRPDAPESWTLRGTTLEFANDTSGAIKAYQQALSIDKRNEKALNQLYVLFLKRRDWNGLINTFKRLVEQDSANYSARLLLAEGYFYADQLDNARQAALPLLKNEERRARANLLLGRIATGQNMLDEAKTYFEELTRISPQNPRAWEFLAVIYLQSGEFEKCAALLEKALETLPDDQNLLSLYGNALQQLNRYSDAVAPLKKAHQLDSSDLNTTVTLGLVYDELHMYPPLDSLYSAALQQFPDNALLLNNYSYSLGERGIQLERAMEMVRRALQVEPNNAAYYDTAGWIQYKLGKYQQARDDILKSLEIQPENPEVVEHMGDVYQKLGDIEKARQYWNNALRLAPENDALKTKLNAH